LENTSEVQALLVAPTKNPSGARMLPPLAAYQTSALNVYDAIRLSKPYVNHSAVVMGAKAV